MTNFRFKLVLQFVLVVVVLAVSISPAIAARSSSPDPAALPLLRMPGGPDGFGYTWLNSADPGGPVFSWIDISATGTLVTGLTDDNSVAAIPLPFPFRFYWADAQQIKIGSNGWIAFDSSVSNIASCFPALPTAGGAGDNYLAPFMSDLIFNAPGGTGEVRYLIDTLNQRVIVSFLNVPYWQAAAPGFFGSNTFQVILDAVTRRITYQYMNLTAPALTAACNDLVGGIESPQGGFGLGLFLDALPAANSAIEFTYPNPPLISVIDPTPNAVQNAASAGIFVAANTPLTLNATVTNDGDSSTTSAVTARGRVITSAAATIYDQNVSIPALAGGASTPVTFVPDATLPEAHYAFQVDVSGGGDINPGNNLRQTEIAAVATTGNAIVFDYVGSASADGDQNWTNTVGGIDTEGMAVLFVPPVSGLVATSISAWIDSFVATGYKLRLVDNDGPGGLPGTMLREVIVPAGQVIQDTWQNLPITPTAVDSDGFYVVWIDEGNIGLGTHSVAPISRRSLELVGGSFATWRSNSSLDVLLRATLSLSDDIFRNGFE